MYYHMWHIAESLFDFFNGQEWMSIAVSDILVTIEFLVFGDVQIQSWICLQCLANWEWMTHFPCHHVPVSNNKTSQSWVQTCKVCHRCTGSSQTCLKQMCGAKALDVQPWSRGYCGWETCSIHRYTIQFLLTSEKNYLALYSIYIYLRFLEKIGKEKHLWVAIDSNCEAVYGSAQKCSGSYFKVLDYEQYII